ncbi:hypothetical protein XSR1_300011 [Xenorhabdus szentirmaii DSM 16338]|uniref:Uncharacterized protein n=1 Tax=Xenorhabdus szentirmaii DSM 16338 TaxID=1427518 RepID=W1J009_9GAMM|nr:hypothetical protein XSR1_300011 [Xenorhabdus szentirmaii DSM 16338]
MLIGKTTLAKYDECENMKHINNSIIIIYCKVFRLVLEKMIVCNQLLLIFL